MSPARERTSLGNIKSGSLLNIIPLRASLFLNFVQKLVFIRESLDALRRQLSWLLPQVHGTGGCQAKAGAQTRESIHQLSIVQVITVLSDLKKQSCRWRASSIGLAGHNRTQFQVHPCPS